MNMKSVVKCNEIISKLNDLVALAKRVLINKQRGGSYVITIEFSNLHNDHTVVRFATNEYLDDLIALYARKQAALLAELKAEGVDTSDFEGFDPNADFL